MKNYSKRNQNKQKCVSTNVVLNNYHLVGDSIALLYNRNFTKNQHNSVIHIFCSVHKKIPINLDEFVLVRIKCLRLFERISF